MADPTWDPWGFREKAMKVVNFLRAGKDGRAAGADETDRRIEDTGLHEAKRQKVLMGDSAPLKEEHVRKAVEKLKGTHLTDMSEPIEKGVRNFSAVAAPGAKLATEGSVAPAAKMAIERLKKEVNPKGLSEKELKEDSDAKNREYENSLRDNAYAKRFFPGVVRMKELSEEHPEGIGIPRGKEEMLKLVPKKLLETYGYGAASVVPAAMLAKEEADKDIAINREMMDLPLDDSEPGKKK